MAKIQIDELDLSPSLQEMVKMAAAEEGKQQALAFINAYKKKLEFPRFMNYKQAASYMSTSYNTLKKVFIDKKGLKVVMIEGYERIDQKDADAFLDLYKK
ncbi:DNA-binding protein [Candidatus Enterococcus courvalinii]|uniref:DNA-binding protein n=1 Tax=Candidatus Enterococcus courvalinii TaxID=2815329 RepID=A0ABS3HZB8_9ENTE|nr:DNA-binding protein [Enterococcus sp. MSG2901]MBO0481805.1 DNA-binding protein [Enterococcus sp. MSG2901]